jgi:hypothetical protein
LRSAISRASARRDAENELFDRGCDLVEAAAAIRGGVAARQAARAVPALLGCVEAAVAELRAASALLTTSSIEAGAAEDDAMARRAERMERGLANLQVALADAETAAGAARALVARVTAGLR